MIQLGAATYQSFSVTILILSALLGFNVYSTIACSCMGPFSVDDAYKAADFIVLGNLTGLEYGEYENTISLQSITCFKGNCRKTEHFSTSSFSTSCGFYPFTKDALDFDEDPVGGIFLVYAMVDTDSRTKRKKKFIHSCSGTKLIDKEAAPVAMEIDLLHKFS
jgi:hypothetical protein